MQAIDNSAFQDSEAYVDPSTSSGTSPPGKRSKESITLTYQHVPDTDPEAVEDQVADWMRTLVDNYRIKRALRESKTVEGSTP